MYYNYHEKEKKKKEEINNSFSNKRNFLVLFKHIRKHLASILLVNYFTSYFLILSYTYSIQCRNITVT